ncbi:MAG: OmpA family protein [Myxococcota bacterium]
MASPRQTEDEPYVIRTGDFQDVSLERPALQPAKTSVPWTLILLAVLLTAAAVTGAYYGLPLYRELEERRVAAERFETQLKETNQQITALQLEKATLDAEKTRLTGELAEKAAADKAVVDEAQRVADELGALLQEEIKKGEAEVRVVNARTIVDVSDGVLFDLGKAELNERGKGILQRLGETLTKVDGKVVQVGAHSDTPTISGKLAQTFATSWELSSARATSVVRFLEEQVKIPGARLVAAGFSAYRPVASNGSSSGRRKNRRIEIALLPLPDKS